MDFNKSWTPFALECESENYGFSRIAAAHNQIAAKLSKYEKVIEKIHSAIKRRCELRDSYKDAPGKSLAINEIIIGLNSGLSVYYGILDALNGDDTVLNSDVKGIID
jgi:hypothetical protein